jgi:hypothetical protein
VFCFEALSLPTPHFLAYFGFIFESRYPHFGQMYGIMYVKLFMLSFTIFAPQTLHFIAFSSPRFYWLIIHAVELREVEGAHPLSTSQGLNTLVWK